MDADPDHHWALRVACAVVAVALVVGSPGIFINDEIDQAVALHNVVTGSLVIRERPHEFFTVAGLNVTPRYPGIEPVGSTLLNYPAAVIVLGIETTNAADYAGDVFAAAFLGLVWLARPRLRDGRPFLAGLVAMYLPLAAGFVRPGVQAGAAVEVLALAVTNLLLLGLCTYFLARLVRPRLGPAALPLLLAVVAGPLVFWGFHQKYTMLAACLVAVALWLAGQTPSPSRDSALGLMAGFGVWNNVGPGAVLAMGIGLLVLIEAFRVRRLAGLGWSALGLALALVPWMLENAATTSNPLLPPYLLLQQGPAPAGHPSAVTPLFGFGKALLDLGDWHGWKDWAFNLFGSWTLGFHVEGLPIGVLLLSPLLACAFMGPLRRPRSEELLALLLLAIQVLFFTNRTAHQGAGYDVRLLAPTLPALGVLAVHRWASFTKPWDERTSRQALTVAVTASGLAIVLLMAAFLARGFWPWGKTRTAYFAFAGLLAVAMIALLALRRAGFLALSRQQVQAVSVGLALALPLLWTGIVTSVPSGLPSTDERDSVLAFLPAVDLVRHAAEARLLPPGPLPVVVVDNVTVFDGTYGNCLVVPNPCRWGQNATSPGFS